MNGKAQPFYYQVWHLLRHAREAYFDIHCTTITIEKRKILPQRICRVAFGHKADV
jgi:hypothetical protein